MPITVAMIEEKEFKTKMRGYDPVEVDEFLDDICDEMVAMQEEIATLNQRLSQAALGGAYAPAAAPVPSVTPAPVPPPAAVQQSAPKPAPRVQEAPAAPREETSEAAQRLLNQAQKVYDQTVAEAKAKAEEILNDANEKASMDMEALEDEKQALMQEVDMLKQTAKDYRERFLRLIEDQQHVLKAETSLFE
jgi:cell division initiation protein